MTNTSRSLLAAGTALAAAGLVAPAPALAAPVTVTGGATDWQIARSYGSSGGASRTTWLGYLLNSGDPLRGASNGTVTASGGAELIAPDGATRSTSVTHTDTPPAAPDAFWTAEFDITGGTIDAETGEADVTATGTLNFSGHAGAVNITVANPRIKIAADGTGGVYAGGSDGTNPIDDTKPIFKLDASAASFAQLGGGRIAIANLVPTLGDTAYFGAAYAPGVAGPNRTPNIFGGFSLLATGAAVAPVAGKPVIKEITKTVTETVERVVDRITEVPVDRPVPVDRVVERQVPVQTFTERRQVVATAPLTKRPFGTSPVTVTVRVAGASEVLGTGFVAGKRLTVIVPEGTALRGKYKLTRTSGSKRLKRTSTVTVAAATSRR